MEYHCKYDKLVSPGELKSHPKNPNRHTKKQVEILAGVIRRIGWRLSIIVSNRSGFIVSGHCRRLVASKEECMAPVSYQDFENETQELEFLMADNITHELAQMDDILRLENLKVLELENIELVPLELKPLKQNNSENLPSHEEKEPYHMDVWAKTKESIDEAYEKLVKDGFHCVRSTTKKS